MKHTWRKILLTISSKNINKLYNTRFTKNKRRENINSKRVRVGEEKVHLVNEKQQTH